jgi:hypothetical protein
VGKLLNSIQKVVYSLCRHFNKENWTVYCVYYSIAFPRWVLRGSNPPLAMSVNCHKCNSNLKGRLPLLHYLAQLRCKLPPKQWKIWTWWTKYFHIWETIDSIRVLQPAGFETFHLFHRLFGIDSYSIFISKISMCKSVRRRFAENC